MAGSSSAAVVTKFGSPLEIQEIQLPDPEIGSVLGKVDAATLCGTDVHIWSGHSFVGPEKIPYIPGHETTAIAMEVHGDVRDTNGEPLTVGTRFIANYPYCGHCYYCSVVRQANLCADGARYGRERVDIYPYLLGGTSEVHYYPPGADFVRVPDSVPSALAASAACALRTIMHGMERLGPVASHEVVLIQGAGAVGLYALAAALERGARSVYVFGAPDERLETATNWGANGTQNIEKTSPQDRLDWLREQTNGRGADVVIQAATASALPEAMDLARKGGRVLSIGGGSGDLAIPAYALTTKYLNIIGVLQAEARHYHQAIQFLEANSEVFPFETLITGQYPLQGVSDALAAMSRLEEIKPVILPNGLG